jgi:hypothetical protein
MRTELKVIPLRERFSGTGQVGYAAYMRYDIHPAWEKAFCRVAGITT